MLLLKSYSWQELRTLGLEKFEADGKPVLNIEGAAFHDDALYLGLKEPVSSKGAIIWKWMRAPVAGASRARFLAWKDHKLVSWPEGE